MKLAVFRAALVQHGYNSLYLEARGKKPFDAIKYIARVSQFPGASKLSPSSNVEALLDALWLHLTIRAHIKRELPK
jgi:hypothetical protein